jgi:hypothetical protein
MEAAAASPTAGHFSIKRVDEIVTKPPTSSDAETLQNCALCEFTKGGRGGALPSRIPGPAR